MYVQFPNANFMKNALFANNKTLNIYSVFVALILGNKLMTDKVEKKYLRMNAFIFMHSKLFSDRKHFLLRWVNTAKLNALRVDCAVFIQNRCIFIHFSFHNFIKETIFNPHNSLKLCVWTRHNVWHLVLKMMLEFRNKINYIHLNHFTKV